MERCTVQVASLVLLAPVALFPGRVDITRPGNEAITAVTVPSFAYMRSLAPDSSSCRGRTKIDFRSAKLIN